MNCAVSLKQSHLPQSAGQGIHCTQVSVCSGDSPHPPFDTNVPTKPNQLGANRTIPTPLTSPSNTGLGFPSTSHLISFISVPDLTSGSPGFPNTHFRGHTPSKTPRVLVSPPCEHGKHNFYSCISHPNSKT